MDKIAAFKAMDTSKKIKLGLLVVLLFVVLYLFKGFLGSDDLPVPPSTPVKSATDTQTSAATPVTTVVAPSTNVLVQNIQPIEDSLLKNAKTTQQKYLKASDELKLLQLEEKIAETKRAIVAAQLDALKAQTEMKTITTPPPSAPINYGQALTNPTATPTTAVSNTAPLPSYSSTSAVESTDNENYKLLYVANQGGVWEAIIGSNGKLYSVTTNSVLPDGTTVVAISGNNVQLIKGSAKRVISITPVM